MSELKLCKDCKYHTVVNELQIFFKEAVDMCNSPHLRSVITGEIKPETCYLERMSPCGRDGRYFESKE